MTKARAKTSPESAAQVPVPSALWHYLHTGDGRGCFHRVARWTATHLYVVATCGDHDDAPVARVSRTGLDEIGEVKVKIATRAGEAVLATMLVPPTVESDDAVPFVWHRVGSKPCLHRVRESRAKGYTIDRACGCFERGSSGPGASVPRLGIGASVAVKLREWEWFYRPVVGAWAPVSTAPTYVPPKPPRPRTPPKTSTYRRHEREARERAAREHAETYERVWREAYARVVAEEHRTDDLRALGLDAVPADLDALRAAWRTAAKRHHPDAGGDAARFTRAKTAYDRLAQTLAAAK